MTLRFGPAAKSFGDLSWNHIVRKCSVRMGKDIGPSTGRSLGRKAGSRCQAPSAASLSAIALAAKLSLVQRLQDSDRGCIPPCRPVKRGNETSHGTVEREEFSIEPRELRELPRQLSAIDNESNNIGKESNN